MPSGNVRQVQAEGTRCWDSVSEENKRRRNVARSDHIAGDWKEDPMKQRLDTVELYSFNGTWYVRTVENEIIRYVTFTTERLGRCHASETAERLDIKVEQPIGE